MNAEPEGREARWVLQGSLAPEQWIQRHSHAPRFAALHADLMFDALLLAPEAKRAIAILQCEQLPNNEHFNELLFHQLASNWARVRWQAMRTVQNHMDRFRQHLAPLVGALSAALATDGSWMNRQQALKTLVALRTWQRVESIHANDSPSLATHAEITQWLTKQCSSAIQVAASDPHWRVRDAAAQALMDDDQLQSLYLKSSASFPSWTLTRRDAADVPERWRWREAGVRTFIGGDAVTDASDPSPPVEEFKPETWDWDPSVLARKLSDSNMSPRQWRNFVARYVGHEDERVQRAAIKHLEPTSADVRAVLQLLNDLRHPARDTVQHWLSVLDVVAREEAMAAILEAVGSDPHLTVAEVEWALRQVAALAPIDGEDEGIADALQGLFHGSELQDPARFLDALRALMDPSILLSSRVRDAMFDLLQLLPADWICKLCSLAVTHAPRRLLLDALESTDGCSPGFWRLVKRWLDRWPIDTFHRVLTAVGIRSKDLAIAAETQMDQPGSHSWQPRCHAACEALWSMVDAGLVSVTSELASAARRLGSWRLRRTCASRADSVAASMAQDPCSAVRAAALRSGELRKDESSWHVVRQASLLAKRPLWELAPGDCLESGPEVAVSESRPTPTDAQPSVSKTVDADRRWTVLGDDGMRVSRIGVSGHYGLPVRGFSAAVEAGINLFFWEPGYTTMSQFCCESTSAWKASVHWMAGTFKATGKGIKQDVRRALRAMKLERLSLFMLFWTRSWERLTDDVIQSLEELVDAGDLQNYSLSTHDRSLACEAIADAAHARRYSGRWNPIMVRYSAAHRGAEQQLLPAAQQAGVSVITFNNTCYGRLLKTGEVAAADCYRFALAHPAVTATLSAPASMQELEQNLEAFQSPEIAPERYEALKRHGAEVYAQDQRFDQCIRRR